MAISKLRIILLAVSVFAVLGLSQIVLESHADARAGGGSSGGFRGSRSYQSPTRPAQPSQPRREATPPPQQPAPLAPQPGGFMRGLGTAILGGFLGSMLFSGIANAGGLGGLGGSGFGMMEVLLLGGLGYFLYRKFRSPAGRHLCQPAKRASRGNAPRFPNLLPPGDGAARIAGSRRGGGTRPPSACRCAAPPRHPGRRPRRSASGR